MCRKANDDKGSNSDEPAQEKADNEGKSLLYLHACSPLYICHELYENEAESIFILSNPFLEHPCISYLKATRRKQSSETGGQQMPCSCTDAACRGPFMS